MSPLEDLPDDALADQLLAWDEALQKGSPLPKEANLPPDQRARLEGDLRCLRHLRQALGHDAAPEESASLPDLGSDRFVIERELGRGAHGIVYLAFDTRLGRSVALKVARPEVLATPPLRERFLRGARAAAGLDHPNLVPLYEAGEIGLVCYTTTAYCPGPTLADWLRDNPAPVPPLSAARLMATLAGAMDHAHQRGVVHRDLKPTNILLHRVSAAPHPPETEASALAPAGRPFGLLSADVVPKITDFGLAKFLEGSDPDGTASGAIVGTPCYMAPEQAAGRAHAVGPPADVYALGAVLYELLTGRPPFRGETVFDTVRQVVENEPVTPRRLQPRCPRDLETICLKCLEKEPRRRYTCARALAEDLHRFLHGLPIHARPAGWVERSVKWMRRQPALAALIALSILVTLGALAGSLRYNALLKDERDRAVDNERKASQKEAEAKRLSQVAQEHARTNRRLLSAAQMNLAERAWEAGQINRVHELLEAQRPPEGQEDLRGFAWYYLRRQIDGSRFSWQGWRPARVGDTMKDNALALAPDGRTAATADGMSIRLWDVATGRERATLQGHLSQVHHLVFSADGRTLASAAGDGTVRLWDTTTGRLQRTLGWQLFGVRRLALSPSGKWLAGTAQDSTIKLWEVETGKVRGRFKAGTLGARIMVFGPDERTLAIVTRDREEQVSLWDLPSGKRRALLEGHRDLVGLVRFAPDGRTLVTRSEDRTAAVWDTATGKRLRLFEAPDKGWLTGASFSPDGQTLALAVGHAFEFLKPGRVVLWNTATWEKRKTWEVPGGGSFVLAYSPDGSKLAVGENGGCIRVHDLQGAREPVVLYGHRERVNYLAFAPHGRTLTSLSLFDGMVKQWDLVPRSSSTLRPGHKARIEGIAFSPTGQVWASAGMDGTVRLRDPMSGHERFLFGCDIREVHALAFAADGKTLATGGAKGVVQRWDLSTRQGKGESWIHPGEVFSLAFAPDGRRLVTAGGSDDAGEVVLWDAATGKQLARWRDPSRVWSVVFSSDGRLLAWVSRQRVTVWDLAAGRALLVHRENGLFMTVAFSPDSKTLVTGTWTRLVRRWNISENRELPVLKGHTDSVLTLAFSSDGRTLASAGNDATVKLWDAATGSERFTLHGHNAIRSVAFRPDGRGLVAGLADGRVQLWDVSDDRVDDAWLKHVAALPAEEQVGAVVRMLQVRNPGFDGQVKTRIAEGAVVGLELCADEITDLSPLRALTKLRELSCNGSAPGKGKLWDLAPVQDLPLTVLNCKYTQVSDLSPLKGKRLTVLSCGGTPVSDLLLVRALPLEHLDCGATRIADLSFLEGMRLTELYCNHTRITDLSPLRGMPLRLLDCGGTKVCDLTPLKDMRLDTLYLYQTPVSDLSPLKGMPLRSLALGDTRAADLTPLKGMRLDLLYLYRTPVADLAPLKGMPLRTLAFGDTAVADLSPLKGMPLVLLYCYRTRVSDLLPLQGMSLQELSFDVKSEGDLAVARSLKTLKTINGLPAAQFWKSPASRPRRRDQASRP